MALAERAGLEALVRRHVAITAKTGVYPGVKVGCLVAGMAAGADSIDDLDLLRHGAMPDLLNEVRAPSTLGLFLRSFTWGNVRQLQVSTRDLLAELARQAPLLPGADHLAFVDIDSMQRRVYSHKKQGAAFRHTKISGKTVLIRRLNTLTATVCTPTAAPVIAGTRLRGGIANTARGAASFAAEAIGAARAAGCTGTIAARADSGFYNAAFTAACRRAGARAPHQACLPSITAHYPLGLTPSPKKGRPRRPLRLLSRMPDALPKRILPRGPAAKSPVDPTVTREMAGGPTFRSRRRGSAIPATLPWPRLVVHVSAAVRCGVATCRAPSSPAAA